MDKRFRQYNWYHKIGVKRADAKMIQIIRKKFKNPTIIMGDASIGISMRHFISTPNLHIKRKLKEVFSVLMADEFRTSLVNYKTQKAKTGHLHYLSIKSKTDSKLVSRKLHAVLTYNWSDNRKAFINRDRNACYNLEIIYNHYIRYLEGKEEFSRPEIFRRSYKLTDSDFQILQNVSNPTNLQQ